jgi:1-acyl-sn-glycerol-3-phosphate acyltransferase
MLYIRSFIFDIYFYIVCALVSVFCLPFLLGPISWSFIPSRLWGYLTLFGARWILGLDYKIEGAHNLPEKPYIIASKHQSAWETVAMCYLLPSPVFIMKKELKYVPLFNLYFARQKVIAVDRKLGKDAIIPMIEAAKFHMQGERCILIYPEGTRSEVGKSGRYRPGVFSLQEGLGVPVVPIALNSGAFWPRRSMIKKQGVITMSILPPIQPGLSREEFMKTLQTVIENRSNQLYEEVRSYDKTKKKSCS